MAESLKPLAGNYMGYLRKNRLILMSICASMLISGCAVSPEPILPDEIKKSVDEDLKLLNKVSQPVTKAITLDEAINRAIKNNIRNRVQIMESALAYKQIDLVYYDMLPSLTTNAGYSVRSNYAASASTTFENGQPAPITGTPTYSISQDKQRLNADISFSWNILDFGLSYVRAQQQSDKYLMAKENEKKVMHNIVQEVRRTYYKSVSSDALLKRIIPMMKEVESALSDSRKVKKLRLSSPIETLSYQRDLLEVLRSLQALERSLLGSKIELAELMGLKAGTSFELDEKVKKSYDLPVLDIQLKDMEKVALANRPEVLESRYKQRISEKETTTAILKMLPGINLNAGMSYNDSDYLLNNDWNSVGASMSWNLLNIFKSNTYQKIAKTKIELAREQKLAISMAVLSQVHLSVVNFNQAKKEYQLSKEYLEVAEEIFEFAKVSNNLNMNSKLVFIKEKLNYILATLRHSSSYANVQNSYGRIFASLGTYEDMNKKKEDKEEVVNKKQTPMVKTIESKKMQAKMKKEEKPMMNSSSKVKIAIANRNAYVRDEANWSSPRKVMIRKNQKIRVLAKIKNTKGYWIETPNGYVSSKSLNNSYISGLPENAMLDMIDSNAKVMYTAKSIKSGNIRVEPNWKSAKRYLLERNKMIDIYDVVSTKGGVWYKTKFGYVSGLVVKIQEKK